MFCSKCGTQIEDGADFCSKCGNKLSEIASSAAILSGNSLPTIEKSPEYGQRVMSTEALDPYYKTFKAAIKVLRIILCLALIWQMLGEYSLIVLILIIALCVWISKLLERFIINVYEQIKIKKYEDEMYSSYVNTNEAKLIAPFLMAPMLSHDIRISVGKQGSNIIDITYSDRKYNVTFGNHSGGCFFIECAADSNNSYEDICSDIPMIAFYIQDVLRNL